MTATLEAAAPAGAPPLPPQERTGAWRSRWLRPAAYIFAAGSSVGFAAVVLLHVTVLVVVALPAALLFAAAAVAEPVFALALLQAVVWSNVSDAVGSHHGLSVYLLTLALSMVSVFFARKRQTGSLLGRSPLYLLLALVVGVQALSLLLSPYHLTSLANPTERLKDIVFFLVTVALIRISGRYMLAVKVMVLTIAALAALTVVQQYGLHNSTTFGGLSTIPVGADIGSATVRHAGPQGDVNFWGRTIVLVSPLALSLAVLAWRRRWVRWVWVMGILFLAAGEYLTQSRGGLIAFALAATGWLLVAGWRYRRWFVLIPVAVVVLAVSVPGLSTRLGTLTQLTHVSVSTTDPSLLGRVQAQEVGLAMFKAHPATGVGLGNFIPAEPDYVDRAGVLNTGMLLAPHDLYLELAAEQGLIGLGAWLLFFGGALLLAVRAAVLARTLGDEPARLVSIGLLWGLVGWAVAGVVLHLAYLNDLLSVMAVVAILDGWIRQRARSVPLIPAPEEMPRLAARRRSAVAATARALPVLGAGGCAAAAVLVLFPLHHMEYTASATAAVRPAASTVDYNNAYVRDTINRPAILNTMAAISADIRFVNQAEAEWHLTPSQRAGLRVSAVGDPANAVLRLSVTGPDPVLASHIAGQVLNDGRAYLGSLVTIYQIDPVSSVVVSPTETLNPLVSAGVSVIVVVSALAAIRRGRRRAPAAGAQAEKSAA